GTGDRGIHERAAGPAHLRGEPDPCPDGHERAEPAEYRDLLEQRDDDEHDCPEEDRSADASGHRTASGSPVARKPSTRRQASSHSVLNSATDRSKNECGAPG